MSAYSMKPRPSPPPPGSPASRGSRGESILRANAAHLTISRARYERDLGCASISRSIIEACLQECEGLLAAETNQAVSAWTRAALLANVVQARALLGDFAGALGKSTEALQLAESLNATTASSDGRLQSPKKTSASPTSQPPSKRPNVPSCWRAAGQHISPRRRAPSALAHL